MEWSDHLILCDYQTILFASGFHNANILANAQVPNMFHDTTQKLTSDFLILRPYCLWRSTHFFRLHFQSKLNDQWLSSLVLNKVEPGYTMNPDSEIHSATAATAEEFLLIPIFHSLGFNFTTIHRIDALTELSHAQSPWPLNSTRRDRLKSAQYLRLKKRYLNHA